LSRRKETNAAFCDADDRITGEPRQRAVHCLHAHPEKIGNIGLRNPHRHKCRFSIAPRVAFEQSEKELRHFWLDAFLAEERDLLARAYQFFMDRDRQSGRKGGIAVEKSDEILPAKMAKTNGVERIGAVLVALAQGGKQQIAGLCEADHLPPPVEMLLIESQQAVAYDVDILRFVALTENRLVRFHGHKPRCFREYGPLGIGEAAAKASVA
jgi:hypothetical protein